MRDRSVMALLLAGATALAGVGEATAAKGLSGNPGDVKKKITFNRFQPGECKKLYDTYVAAPGHSAFAATVIDTDWGGYVCAITINAGTTAAAEKNALEECRKALKKNDSIEAFGPCMIYSSK